MNHFFLVIVFCAISSLAFSQDTIHVRATDDFELSVDTTGKWKNADWIILHPDISDNRTTHLKILYSKTGMYFLFKNDDKIITSTMKNDFDSLWLEDVAEIFLWPDTSITNYLEYEISPHNKELVMLIVNINGKHSGWHPWQYSGKRRVKHKTKIIPGRCWYAEVYIPYRLLYPMVLEQPVSGKVWRANFYRSDRDNKITREWSWKTTARSFHEYKRFGYLLFQ